jgi:hypothetical protein
MTHPQPEVELRRFFVELLGETESRLREVKNACKIDVSGCFMWYCKT